MGIDACRNTYVEGLETSERGQLQDSFFSTVPAPGPTSEPPAACVLISWSTQSGQTVPDGEPGRHSPYVAALLTAIMEDVQLRTQGSQSTCVDDMGSLLKKGAA